MYLAANGVKALARHTIDWLYPPQCLLCSEQVLRHGSVCAICWEQLEFISAPCCVRCGYPFQFETMGQSLCGVCIGAEPPYHMARAVLRYNDASRALVAQLKYADQTQLAITYGQWLATHGQEVVSRSQLILPVPLHYWRFLQRRYNQSALLAMSLSKECGLPCLPDAIMRTRATRPQTQLNRTQRERNVNGAFAVRRRVADALAGRSVLLIDDVMTTSATIHACCAALLRVGVGEINVLTFARRVS